MLNNTSIPGYENIQPKPFPSGGQARAIINKIALCIGLYVVFIMYPLYTLMRLWWNPEYPMLDAGHGTVAILTGLFFAWFSRRSMIGRITEAKQPDVEHR